MVQNKNVYIDRNSKQTRYVHHSARFRTPPLISGRWRKGERYLRVRWMVTSTRTHLERQCRTRALGQPRALQNWYVMELHITFDLISAYKKRPTHGALRHAMRNIKSFRDSVTFFPPLHMHDGNSCTFQILLNLLEISNNKSLWITVSEKFYPRSSPFRR